MFNLPSTSSGGFNGSLSGMDLDLDPAVLAAAAANAAEPLPDLPPLPERQKSKKEMDQDKKDLELSELLNMMDEWKPIVRNVWGVGQSSRLSSPSPLNALVLLRARQTDT